MLIESIVVKLEVEVMLKLSIPKLDILSVVLVSFMYLCHSVLSQFMLLFNSQVNVANDFPSPSQTVTLSVFMVAVEKYVKSSLICEYKHSYV